MNSIEFKLDSEEAELANAFMLAHKDCCFENFGKEFFSTTGGGFSFIITPTGIGNCIIIRCNSCNTEKDITNVDNW